MRLNLEGESYISELQVELKNTMMVQNIAGSDAMGKEIKRKGAIGTEEVIDKIYEEGGSQCEGSQTDMDKRVEVKDDEDC
ncbi:hypothetical protein BGX38DRAFT_1279933 [Terfezia claveryi]|nr:hypothetical protein BGX38DRAFT_1279933 [Terfezia claveryi]